MKNKNDKNLTPSDRMNPKVDAYIRNNKRWQEELKKLRTIIRECPLTEDFKWGVPCYTFNDSNVVLVHVFKEYCAILFVKGALLKDAKKVLVQQTANVQAGRQIRFTDVSEVTKIEKVIKDYILEAIENEKAGLKVEMKKTLEFAIPEEFKSRLDKNKALNTAFHALTPGRQRAYLLYFSSAKQSRTRESRIEKYTAQILKGKGLDD